MVSRRQVVHAWGMETDQQTAASAGGPEGRGPLRRNQDDKVVAGVCSGLARHFGVDPIIFRIGFVALTLAGAAGFVIYGLAWLFVPEDGQATSKGRSMMDDHRLFHGISQRTLGWGLAVVAAVVLLGDWGDSHGRDGLVPALVLGGVALAVLGSRSHRAGGTPSDGTPGGPPSDGTPGGTPSDGTPSGALTGGGGTVLDDRPAAGAGFGGPGATPAGIWPPTPASTASAARPPKPPRSPLGRVAVSLLCILGGGLLLVDRAGLADVTVAAFLALALVGTGLALVLGSWWGRARPLIAVGLLLAGAAAVVTVIDVPLGAGVGERTIRPTGVNSLAPSYRLAAGEMTLDLRDAAPAAGRTEVVTARVGVGHLVVILPDAAGVVVDSRVGAGEVDVLGRSEEGTNIRSRREEQADREGGGHLDLRLSAGVGQIEVRR